MIPLHRHLVAVGLIGLFFLTIPTVANSPAVIDQACAIVRTSTMIDDPERLEQVLDLYTTQPRTATARAREIVSRRMIAIQYETHPVIPGVASCVIARLGGAVELGGGDSQPERSDEPGPASEIEGGSQRDDTRPDERETSWTIDDDMMRSESWRVRYRLGSGRLDRVVYTIIPYETMHITPFMAYLLIDGEIVAQTRSLGTTLERRNINYLLDNEMMERSIVLEPSDDQAPFRLKPSELEASFVGASGGGLTRALSSPEPWSINDTLLTQTIPAANTTLLQSEWIVDTIDDGDISFGTVSTPARAGQLTLFAMELQGIDRLQRLDVQITNSSDQLVEDLALHTGSTRLVTIPTTIPAFSSRIVSFEIPAREQRRIVGDEISITGSLQGIPTTNRMITTAIVQPDQLDAAATLPLSCGDRCGLVWQADRDGLWLNARSLRSVIDAAYDAAQ